jgi:hypothetical protein
MVSREKIRRPSGTCTTPRSTMSQGLCLVMSSPRAWMVPALGRTTPDTADSVEVLPAPLLPRTATISPSPTRSDMPCSAWTRP